MLLGSFDIEADQLSTKLNGTAVILKNTELSDSSYGRESSLAKIAGKEFPGQADLMVIVGILLTAKNHIHYVETLLRREGRMQKQFAQHFEIRDAASENTSRFQNPVDLLECAEQVIHITQVFEDV